MPSLLSFRKYAKHRGVTLSAVQKAIKTQRITPVVEQGTGKLKIDPAIADAQWARNTDVDQQLRGNGGVLPAGPAALDLPPAGDGTARGQQPGADEGDREKLLQHKTESAELDNELKRLELGERRGELVSVEELRAVGARRYRALRDRILGIPDRLSWLSREDRVKLAAELKRTLHELSDDARAESARGAEECVAA